MQSIDQKLLHSATVAGGAAWTDAAFMAMFFDSGSSSTGSLIPWLEKSVEHFQTITDICKWLQVSHDDVPVILRTVERYREFLREQHPDKAADFVLSPLQDALNARKAQRLVALGQFINLAWQVSGEAFWLYLETSKGLPLEKYLQQLPTNLVADLENVGLLPLDTFSIRELCRISDGLVLRSRELLGDIRL